MGYKNLTTQQKIILATCLGTSIVVFKSISALKSPYSSTASSLPRLATNYPTYKNITYKEVDNKSLYLDIYLPHANRSKFKLAPTVVFVHGGSWVQASKNNIKKTFRQYALQMLLKSGFAVVSIDYRLADPLHFHIPEQIADCKDAVRWVRKYGTEYGLDIDNIGMWGSSAGGHLAMMAAYTDENTYLGEESLRDISPKVNYLVDSFGPTDLNSLFRTNMNPVILAIGKVWVRKLIAKRNGQLKCVTGFDVKHQKERVRQLCTEYSPINYVNTSSCPTLILHGTGDTTVKIEQSYKLFNALRKYNVSTTLVRYKKLRHSFCNASSEQAKDIAKRIARFALKNYNSYNPD